MGAITFDTHKFVRKLQEGGFDLKQAESLRACEKFLRYLLAALRGARSLA
ncbi:MAG: hypothetical protein ACOY6N_13840 [Pseudomonadota bacterium]